MLPRKGANGRSRVGGCSAAFGTGADEGGSQNAPIIYSGGAISDFRQRLMNSATTALTAVQIEASAAIEGSTIYSTIARGVVS